MTKVPHPVGTVPGDTPLLHKPSWASLLPLAPGSTQEFTPSAPHLLSPLPAPRAVPRALEGDNYVWAELGEATRGFLPWAAKGQEANNHLGKTQGCSLIPKTRELCHTWLIPKLLIRAVHGAHEDRAIEQTSNAEGNTKIHFPESFYAQNYSHHPEPADSLGQPHPPLRAVLRAAE